MPHNVTSTKVVQQQVVEIFPYGRHGPAYFAWSITWLLMTWRRKGSGHQHPLYWPCSAWIQCSAVITRSIFSHNIQNTPHDSSPIRARYWVCFVGPGPRFTKVFLPAIQIQWKLRLAIIPLLAIRSRQIFAHATTAQLLCHVQNFVAITLLDSRWEWNEISIEFEMQWKNH